MFRQQVAERGLAGKIDIDSAGTAAYHVGNSPDSRATAEARKRGYDLSDLRARQAITADFAEYDYVIAMDAENLQNLRKIAPADYTGQLVMMLGYSDSYSGEVPDPYYGGEAGFTLVLDMLEEAGLGLLEDIQQRHGITV